MMSPAFTLVPTPLAMAKLLHMRIARLAAVAMRDLHQIAITAAVALEDDFAVEGGGDRRAHRCRPVDALVDANRRRGSDACAGRRSRS